MRHEMNPIGQEVFAAAQSRSLWRNALLPFERTLLFVVIYFLAVQTVALYRGEPMLVYFIGYAKMLGLVGPLIISVWIAYSAISMAATTRPSSPIREIGGMMITYVADRQRLVSAAIFFTIVFLITAPFSYIKSIIGQIAPFSWDEKLYRLDLAIHGGVLPSDILQPFLGYPALTFAINIRVWTHNQ